MNVLVTGSSGMIGGHLMQGLTAAGHTVSRLLRGPVRDPEREVRWTPTRDRIDLDGVAKADAVIHLAGKNVASGRWNERLKMDLLGSRIVPTWLLANTLADLYAKGRGPKTLISASATGFYGSRGDEELHEDSLPGEGFFAELCTDWEDATAPAAKAGLRVVNLRLGVVLAKEGGMLKELTPIFKLGVGGRLGSGKQWLPWVHIDDVVAGILYALDHETLDGPINLIAPGIVRHSEFVKTMGKVLNRPAVLPVPAFMVELAMGKEMAANTVLASQRAIPSRIMNTGFRFKYSNLDVALKSLF
jgi:uncharacterized protein